MAVGWRSFRVLVACLALALCGTAAAAAQLPGRPGAPERIGRIPLVLAEHGDPTLAYPLALTLAGSIAYDVSTAPAAVRRYNEANPDAPRSPGTAVALALTATALPVLAGTAAGMRDATGASIVLVYSGLVLGPSTGHWYAGRLWRGLASAGLRFGLVTAAGYVLLMAS